MVGGQHQFPGIEGLDEHSIGTGLDARQSLLLARVRGHRDHGNVAQGAIGTHFLNQVLASHDRHPQARDNQRGCKLQRVVQRFLPIVGKAQLVVLLQVIGDKECHIFVIIDNEHQWTLPLSACGFDPLLGNANG